MASSNICWGIEVGAGGIKAVKLENAGNGEVKLLDFAVVPHAKVLSTPGLEQNDAIRVSLGKFVNEFELGKASVVMSVPGHQAFARFAKLPPVEPKKVPDIVKFEAVQQIPFPIDQVEWDYQTFASPDSPEVEVGIFAITRERVMEKLTLYEDVDIVPDAITLSPVAAYNALAYDLQFSEQTPGTIILDIGTTSTDLVIADAGRVWIRTFPLGGHHFTEALVNAFQLSYPKAEKLKREAESTKHARHVFQAMRPVFGDLAQDVQRSIGYYQSLHRDAKIQRLIGIGSTFRLPGIRKFLKQQLQMDVYRLEQFKRLNLDGPRAGEFQAETLSLATAYGLALQGLGMSTLEANLMPVSLARTSMWKRKVKWFGIAAGVAGLASAAMFYRPFQDSVDITANPAPREVTNVVNEVKRLKAEAADVTGDAAIDPKVGEAQSFLQKREIYGYLVNDLSLMLKDAETKAAALPAPTSGPKPVGPAYSVKSYVTSFVPETAGDGSTPPPSDPNAPAPLTGPRIKIEMVVSTTQPEAQKFMINTLESWLRQNATRDGLPYQLVLAPGNPWAIVAQEEIGDTGERVASRAPVSQPTGRGQPSGRDMEEAIQRGDFVPPPPPPGFEVVGGGAPRPRPTLRGGGGRLTGGPSGPSEQGGLGGDQENAATLESLKKLAPIPADPGLPVGTRVTEFTVKWEAVLVPPKKEEPAAEGAAGGQS